MITAATGIDHLAVARTVAAAPDRWPVAPRFDPAERWYHRLATDARYEVWLLTWLPGQGTDLHDHGGSAGAFHVHAGTLTEETVAGGTRPRLISHQLGAGSGRRFGTRHVHRVTNRSARPAVSIHVYGPALTSMNRYRIENGALTVIAVERSGAQW